MNIKIVSLLLLALLAGNVYCEIQADIEETVELVARHPGHDTGGSTNAGGNKATQAPTRRPATTQAPTRRPATQAPTRRPATQAPTRRPATQAPTRTPTTQAPATQAPTRTPSSGDLCALTPTSTEPAKILVPLYVYPGAQWDQLITAANSGVEIIAIINPNSGPGTKADSAYITYMKKLTAAGIDMIGYVHTTYGDRAFADVQRDIDIYASQFPGLKGIFIDEASATAGDLAYYTRVYQAITAKSGYTNVILNPGTIPVQGYLTISTNIVIFENPGANFARTTFPSWVKCASSAAQKVDYTYRFGAIAYATSTSAMPALLRAMRNQGIGLVYATDGAAGGATYNKLPAYMVQQANAVADIN